MIDFSKYRDPAYYPDGIQDFLDLRNRECVYVDKTALMYEMTRKKIVFLSRPRRFGKSLLCTTLQNSQIPTDVIPADVIPADVIYR